MKALVVSDNHGDRQILSQIVNKWQGQVDLMIHCGDSEIDSTDPLMKNFVGVAGNNDWHLGYPGDLVIEKAGQHFFITHGHHYRVNFTMTPLMLKGASTGADVICYGHTHQLWATVDHGMLVVNPGSISLPRGQYRDIGGTFAIIYADPRAFTVDFYDRQMHRVPDLHVEFSR